MANLGRYFLMLCVAKNSKCVEAGFIHDEGKGLLALDQKGGEGKLQQTRLYIFPHDLEQNLYLITIGNKSEQKADLKTSHDLIKKQILKTPPSPPQFESIEQSHLPYLKEPYPIPNPQPWKHSKRHR